MYEFLKKINKSGKLVSIYADVNDSDSYISGYVLCFDQEHLLLKNISSLGKYNGIVCLEIDHIFKIEYDTILLSIIDEKVLDEEKKIEDFRFKNVLVEFLDYIKRNEIVCSIELIDSLNVDAIGIVKQIEDSYVIINTINEIGVYEGTIVLLIDKIKRIWSDSDDDRFCKELLIQRK